MAVDNFWVFLPHLRKLRNVSGALNDKYRKWRYVKQNAANGLFYGSLVLFQAGNHMSQFD